MYQPLKFAIVVKIVPLVNTRIEVQNTSLHGLGTLIMKPK